MSSSPGSTDDSDLEEAFHYGVLLTTSAQLMTGMLSNERVAMTLLDDSYEPTAFRKRLLSETINLAEALIEETLKRSKR